MSITRRNLLLGAAAMVAAPNVISSARAEANKELLVYAWYTKPIQAIMDDFAAQTKINVKYLGSYGGNPVWWSKMLAGEVWDVFLPSMDWMTRAALAGKVEPLDESKLSSIKYVSPYGQKVMAKELTVDGKLSALPWALTINTLVYNTKFIAPAKATWDVMWDPANAGKISTKDEAIIPILTAAAYLGIQTDDLSKWTKAEEDALLKSLLEQKKLIRKYWTNHEQMGEMLATEQVIAGQWTDGRGRHLAKTFPVKTAVPPQGAPAVIDAIAIMKEAPNKGAAYEFLNFALQPEQQVKISLMHGAVVMNDAANALIPEAERASFAVDPNWNLRWRRFTTPQVSQNLERLWSQVKLART